jgi:energy-coupling factor transport system substrate-specific component
MTWQAAAFAILAVALAAGFAWYERSRPDARIVALVATLAAFAALGRIAFAAVPNVKPTTDIVLISGYALGGAPGFAVGALAGLTSNFFFGQGPWTPWQMAAWGATGIAGAGLAWVSGRRIGRWPLAIVCTVVGFAFTATQDAGDWVTYSDHSLSQLGVYVGKGIGFDCVHAAGCLVFALAFGPALTRSIERFARRLQVTWQPAPDAPGAPQSVAPGVTRAAALALIAVAAAAIGAGALAPARASAGGTPTGYLLSAQHRDGGFGSSPGAASSTLYSGWAALGLAAEGHNPQDVSHSGRSLLAYIRASAAGATDIGSVERTILVARAAGVSASSFGAVNLIARLQNAVRANGSVAGQVNLTAFAVLALRGAGIAPRASTYRWLTAQQDADGGFNFASRGGASDVDDTGAALEALASAGSQAAGARHAAVGFLRSQQDRDGGFAADLGGSSDAQSTAWAIQGLLAAGVNPSTLHRGGAVSPFAYLRSLIGADGHVNYARGDDQTSVWVTGEALMALARKPLPLSAVPRARRPGAASTSAVAATTTATAAATGAGTANTAAGRAHAKRGGAARRAGHRTAPGLASGPALPPELTADAALFAAIALAPVGAG